MIENSERTSETLKHLTIAAVVKALLVVAAAVAPAVADVTSGAVRTRRWTARVVCVISTIAVIKIASLVVALKITIAVA